MNEGLPQTPQPIVEQPPTPIIEQVVPAKDLSTLNFYERLGVTNGATSEELQQAYRKSIAEASRNDIANGSMQTGEQISSKYINEAYQGLKDPTLRSKYDQGLKPQNSVDSHRNNEPLIAELVHASTFSPRMFKLSADKFIKNGLISHEEMVRIPRIKEAVIKELIHAASFSAQAFARSRDSWIENGIPITIGEANNLKEIRIEALRQMAQADNVPMLERIKKDWILAGVIV